MSPATSNLFQPLKIGTITLGHRIVMAPMTRLRADRHHVHHEIAETYYRQRSSVPGTLLITEGTIIAEEAGGLGHAPGIYTDAQVEAWKPVTKAVHANGSFVFLQIAAAGRAANPSILEAEGHPFLAPSAIPIQTQAAAGTPRAMSLEDIKRYLRLFAVAANNAIRAGFDGVEIHGANGYLVDQFIQDVSNVRDDVYGGSAENWARFPLEVVKAVSDTIGPARTALRLSPFATFQDMRMKDPEPTFSHIIRKLRADFPELAYLHVIESDIVAPAGEKPDSTAFAREIWKSRPYLAAQGFTPATAEIFVGAGENIAVAFGKSFIANPDLPYRIKNGLSLATPNPKTFYVPGPENTEGYIDYPAYSA